VQEKSKVLLDLEANIRLKRRLAELKKEIGIVTQRIGIIRSMVGKVHLEESKVSNDHLFDEIDDFNADY
jgi:hypothetical protein